MNKPGLRQLRDQLDRDFGDFNRRRPQPDVDALMRDFLFESFDSYLPARPTGKALLAGLQNAHECELVARYYQSQLILNGSGVALERLALDTPNFRYDLATTSPEQLSRYGSFDGIFSIHTFNFVERPEKILAEAFKALVPGGRLCIATQNARSGSRRMALSMGLIKDFSEIPPFGHQFGQLRFLDRDALRGLIRDAGFKELDSGGVLLKTLVESQMHALLAQGLVGEPYLRALYTLGRDYPDLCTTVYVVAEKS